MILDFVESTQAFVLRVKRNEGVHIGELVEEHGLDLSMTASTPAEAVLFTREPYAAVSFLACATPLARQKLGGLADAIEGSWANDCNRNIACPADVGLWPFQRASIAYALARTHTLVGDEPGLGKTPIAICYANEIQAERVLVICPAAIRLQWAKRISEWSTMPWNRVVHPILHGKHGVHPSANWTIVSYDLCRTAAIGKALACQDYDLLILDEGHYLKTIDSRRTRAIFGGGEGREFDPIVDRAARVLALTGTPLPNRPREAYTLARSLCFESIDWASEDKFKDRFNPSTTREFFDPKTGVTRLAIEERSGRHAELQNRLRGNFMVRHLKREVMPQLQMPVFDIISLEPTRAIKQALEAESLLDIDPENLEGADATILGHVAVVRREMGIAMAPSVADYVDMLIMGGEKKLVIFAWHTEVLNILEARLGKYGAVRIDGSTSPSARERLVARFVSEPGVDICLGNLLAMGVGVDGLQLVSNHALIAEPDWVPGTNVQAFDRLDRGGQTRQVQGDIFVAPGSFAEKVLASALRKHQTTYKALDKRIVT